LAPAPPSLRQPPPHVKRHRRPARRRGQGRVPVPLRSPALPPRPTGSKDLLGVRWCRRPAGRFRHRPACGAHRCLRQASPYPLRLGAARVSARRRAPGVQLARVPADRLVPAVVSERLAPDPPLGPAPVLIGLEVGEELPAEGSPAEPEALRVPEDRAARVAAEEEPLETGAVLPAEGPGDAVDVRSKSSKLRKSLITPRRMHPFPRARSSSSGVRRPRSWVPSSTGPAQTWCDFSSSKARWSRPRSPCRTR